MNYVREYIWCRDNRKNVFLIAAFLLISVVLFYSYIYNDILETTRMGIAFWESLFSGNIRSFYGITFQMDPVAYTKDVHAVYDFSIYIVFAIWDLPLYLLSKFTGIDVFTCIPCLMWAKSLLLVFIILLVKSIYKLCITLEMKEEDAVFVCFLFLTCNFFMTSVVMMSAYDIIALYFTVRGIDYYMQNNMPGFVISFMFAIPLKFFALLVFLPLLLIRQKNILKIIGCSILVVTPIIVFRILIPCTGNGSGLNISNAFNSTNLSNLALLYAIRYYFEMALGRVYFSVLAFGILMAVCYFVVIKEENIKKCGIYLCFLSYAILFTTCYSHPYWLLIMMPFLFIMIIQNKSIIHINLILEMIMSWGMILAQIFTFSWCFGNALCAGMFWPEFFGRKSAFTQFNLVTIIQNMIGESGTRKICTGATGVGSTIFIACIIMISAVNNPLIQTRKLPIMRLNEKAEGWVIPLRMLSGVLVGIIPLCSYVIYMMIG